MRYGRLEDGVLAFEAATLAPSAAASQAAAALTTAE
jgi:hypothetical protein